MLLCSGRNPNMSYHAGPETFGKSGKQSGRQGFSILVMMELSRLFPGLFSESPRPFALFCP